MSGYDTPEEAALSGYPPQHVRLLACRESGDHAVALIDARPDGPPYPYVEQLHRTDGRWRASSSGNGEGGWCSTSDDGELGYAWAIGEAPDGVDRVRVIFGEQIQEEPVAHGFWLSAWWSQPFDGTFPYLVAYRRNGTWEERH